MVNSEEKKEQSGILELSAEQFKEKIKNVLKQNDIGKKIEENKTNNVNKLSNNEESNTEYVALFFSFDIVNSSLYKTLYKKEWLKVITALFKEIQKQIKEKINSAELWRVLGDEEIFVVKILDIDSIYEYINSIYQTLNLIVSKLNNGEFYKKIFNLQEEIDDIVSNNILSLQSTAWIALIHDMSSDHNANKLSGNSSNVFMVYKNDKFNIHEFLGNDIDAGFRIAKYTQSRRLTVSFELAYILAKKTESSSYLRIISYKSLKGVWEGKLYPIIWYHNDILAQKSFDDSFDFDEAEKNELVTEYFKNREGKNDVINKRMFLDTFYALNKIKEDRRLEKKLTEILEAIEKTMDEIRIITDDIVELHFSVICYNKKEEKIFVVKRSNTRSTCAGKWEFGHAVADRINNITDCVKKTYKEDFGMEIEVLKEKNRADVQPIPLFLYEITEEVNKNKGITLVAVVEEISNRFNSNKKYSDAMWIDIDELDRIEEKDAVTDFHANAKYVFSYMKKMEENDGR